MRIKLAALVLSACLVLFGCQSVQSEVGTDYSSMFVEVEWTSNWSVVYHRDTKVMYAVSDGMYNRGTFTLLVNPDGTPMLWEWCCIDTTTYSVYCMDRWRRCCIVLQFPWECNTIQHPSGCNRNATTTPLPRSAAGVLWETTERPSVGPVGIDPARSPPRTRTQENGLSLAVRGTCYQEVV